MLALEAQVLVLWWVLRQVLRWVLRSAHSVLLQLPLPLPLPDELLRELREDRSRTSSSQ